MQIYLVSFEDRLNAILEDGHWEVFKGQRITPLVHKDDYATYYEMDPASGRPKKKKKGNTKSLPKEEDNDKT